MLQGRRNPYVAREGIPLLLVSAVLAGFALMYLDPLWFVLALSVFVLLFGLFRDPHRNVPPAALGVVSPVDGQVVGVEITDEGLLPGEQKRITIRVDSLGTYTARCPAEGSIEDLASVADAGETRRTNALWVQTDEGDDVILGFAGYRLGLPPKSLVRYGERLGQGERCAYLRLARTAEVYVSADSQALVEQGQAVRAGEDLIAKLPRP